ncbi:MAG: hypothetical protein IJ927_05005 [Eubacterium sp.]|nr:hypothetical protein [Eubacterium sp.]
MKIRLSNAKERQTLKGWGTSACWWSQACGDEKTQNEIAELLYGNSGLGLNIYRYNVGGGCDPDNFRVKDPWRRSESFMLYDKEMEETSWDFSRDKNAVEVMKKCLALGNIDTLILFANSPHYSQTSTGQASGSLLPHTCNIPKSKYKAFVDYFLDVTEHFLNEGFPVNYISPINEPQWKWGGSHVWQEGCHYETEEVIEILHLFAKEIIRRELPVKLYAPESGEFLGKTIEYFDAMLKDEEIMKVLGVFAFHSYHSDFNPEIRREFYKKLVKPHSEIRFDMSEWCELPNKSHTRNFKGALITARIIGQDVIYTRSESWTSWVAVNGICINKDDGFDYSDAMMSASPDFSEWYINERYYALAHYSKFIPVGSKALDIGFRPMNDQNRFNISGFRLESGETVLVAVNEGTRVKKLEFDCDFKTMRIIKSTADKKLEEVYNGEFMPLIECEKDSIMTIILK